MKIFRGNSAELLNSSRGSAFISKPVINLIQPLNASKALGLSSVLDEKKKLLHFCASHACCCRAVILIFQLDITPERETIKVQTCSDPRTSY